MNDEIEIDDWPVPSAEVRLELEWRSPAWPEPERRPLNDERPALAP